MSAVMEKEIETEMLRQRLTIQVLDATTLPEIMAARKALRDWMKAYPDDAGMRDAFEQLANLQEVAEQEKAPQENRQAA